MTSGPGPTAGRSGSRTVTLDGLRGVAVLAVVVEHAWPNLLPGGFAGVDVFFVLSGYLITRILLGELATTGRIALWAFYARRVRRILPASLVAVVGTCLLFAVLLGPALPRAMRFEALAATFSVSNFLFVGRSVDYFAADPSSSPFLHFWSLAVEEQFYLVWPSLLVVLAMLSRRLPPRLAAWTPIGAVAAFGLGSLALALVASQADAFFLLPHRGWELIAGGLLAWPRLQTAMRLSGRLQPYRWVGVTAGWAMLVVTFLAAPSLGGWPGWATMLPVAGTALLVAGGDDMPGARVLTGAGLQFFGRISYALYLWHWPLLAAAALLAMPALTPQFAASLGAVGLAVGAATLSTVLLEEPIRSSRVPALLGPRAVMTGVAGMLVVGLVAVGLTTRVPVLLARGDGFSAALRASAGDRERIIRDKCITSMRSAGLKDCVYGAAAGPNGEPVHDAQPDGPVVVLFGDSHAMHWFAAIDAWARERGLPLIPLVRSACPPVDAEMAAGDRRMRRSCVEWRTLALERIASLDTVLVVASGSTAVPIRVGGEVPAPRRDGAASAWVDPAAAMLAKLAQRSTVTLFLGDTPRPGFPAPACLAAHRWARGTCSLPLGVAAPAAMTAAESAAAEQAGVQFIDPSMWLCPGGTCDWMAGDSVGWIDEHHITASAALHVLPQLAPVLDRAIRVTASDAGVGSAP